MDIQWPLLVFGVLAGLSMGCLGFVCAFILAGKAESLRMPGVVIALAAIAAGGLASAFHLGTPDRILYILGNLQSGITQELLATAVAGVLIVALCIALVKKASPAVLKTLAVLGLIAAIALPFITGEAYVQGARPAWNTLFLPIMYVGAAFAMGALTMTVLSRIKHVDDADRTLIGRASFVAAIICTVTVVLYVSAVALAPYPDPSRSIDRLLSGDLALLFWGAAVALGLIVPLALTAMQAFGKQPQAKGGTAVLSRPSVLFVGLVCLVAGSVAIRSIMYLLGSSVQSFIY